jgi:hypothetical protein
MEDDRRRQTESDSEKKKRPWRKCPICWDSIMRHSLRGVLYTRGRSTRSTDGADGTTHIRMRLVQRDTVRCVLCVNSLGAKCCCSKVCLSCQEMRHCQQ